MADRFFRVASFAAAAVVYKTEKKIRRPVGERKKCEECFNEKLKKSRIESAIVEAREKIIRLKNEVGAPGVIVGVSVDGEVVWKEGLGFSDLENQVPAHGDTVMRIASISKSLTAAVVGHLWQEGKIDLDKPIQKYIPNYPEKAFGDYYYTITTRQLMCHLSGIRHYSKMKKNGAVGGGDGQLEEFYGKEKYETVEKSLSIFKDDDLLHPPGSKYLYTTYGWTVVSAVMEGATGKTYPQLMRAFLRDMGMRRTYLDEPDPIIYGRSRYYGKNKSGRIINSPYVDNSCKWAGGGLLSTVGDLLKFANAMLYAYQFGDAIDVSKAKQVVQVLKGRKKEKESMPVIEKQKQERVVKRSYVIDESMTQEPSFDSRLDSAKIDVEGESAEGEDENRVSKIDRIKGVVSVTGTVVKSVGEGVFSVGKYVWGSMQSMRKKQEGESSTGEDENRVSKVDKIKGVVSQTGTAVKSAGEGLASAGNYVWERIWPMTGKKEGESTEGEDENRASKVDKIKGVVSQTGTAVKSAGEGVASAGNYVWERIWPMTGKKEGESTEGKDENRVSKVDKIKGVVSQTGTAVKSAGEGVASAGNYVWERIWPMTGKKEGESTEGKDENRVSKVDKIKGVVSQTGTAVKSAGEGVASAGNYVWERIWPMTGKKEGESTEGKDENRVSKVDKIKGVVSQTGTAVKSAGEGVASAGNYVWERIWPMTGKKEGESTEGKDENTVSKVDKIKGVVSQTGTAVKSAGEGVASAGNYVWERIWPMTGKKEGESTEGKDENRVSKVDKIKGVVSQTGTAVKSAGEGVASAGNYVRDSIWSMTGKKEGESTEGKDENRVSKVDKIKGVVSQTGTAVKSAGEGVASAGNYVWDSIWSMTGKKEGESTEGKDENRVSKVDKIKGVGTQAGTAAKSVGEGVASAGSYLWGRFSSGHPSEKDDTSSKKQPKSGVQKNTGKKDNDDKQESGSWAYLKNVFNPKALHPSVTHPCIQESCLSVHLSVEVSSGEQIVQGILQKEVIPYAVNVILGLNEVDSCHHELPALKVNATKSLSTPYVSQKTVSTLWTRVEKTKFSDWGPHVEGGYGLGFGVAPAVYCPGGVVEGGQPFMIGHTGGAVGASSAFIIMPRQRNGNDPPKGVAVVLLTNLQSVGLNQLAIDITRIFANATK